MKKKYFCLCLLMLLIITTAVAQKPALNLVNYKNWNTLSNGDISDDGNYAFYTIVKRPPERNTLILHSTHSDWKKSLTGASQGVFDKESRILAFKQGDSLGVLNIAQDKLEYIDST